MRLVCLLATALAIIGPTKWKVGKISKSCFVSKFSAAPQEFPGPAYTRASGEPWVEKLGGRYRGAGSKVQTFERENEGGEVVIMPHRVAHKQKHARTLDLLLQQHPPLSSWAKATLVEVRRD